VALPFAGLTIPAAAAVNAAAGQRAVPAAAARALVPLVYGIDRVPALIVNALPSASNTTMLLVQCLWAHASAGIYDLLLNDLALPAGSSATHYTGSQVTADADLVAAFAAQGITYTAALTGFAYSVVAIPLSAVAGQLAFSASIWGRKVYDPRKDSTAGGSGSHRLNDPSTWEWSDNPSLAYADWLASTVYGAGEPVLWSSVPAAANANDAMVGSPAEKHRIIGLTISQSTRVSDLSEALRAYAGVWAVPTSGGVRLVPDAAAATAASYDHAAGQIGAITPLQLSDTGNTPTAVEVVYTDASQVPVRDDSAIAMLSGAGTTLPWRLSTVRLPGIQRYSQAYREAAERLNKLNLGDLSVTVDVFDIGIAHEAGDVVEITHPVGLAAKKFRISDAPAMTGPGRWRLQLAEYDPAAYSYLVATAPTYTNAGLFVSDAAAAGPNLIPNPELEPCLGGAAAPQGWTRFVVGSPLQQAVQKPGTSPWYGPPWNLNAAHYEARVINTNELVQWGTSDFIGVNPTQNYTLACWASEYAGQGDVRVHFGVECYDQAGAFIASVYVMADQRISTTWTRYAFIIGPGGSAFPVGTAKVKPFWQGARNVAVAHIGTTFATRFTFNEGTVPTDTYAPIPVGTSQLEPGAATEIYRDDYDFAGGSYGTTTARSFSITPPVDCTIEVSATIEATNVVGDSGKQVGWWVTPSGGSTVVAAGFRNNQSVRTQLNSADSFTAAAGVALTFELKTNNGGSAPNLLLYRSTIRLSIVKR
jgi:hypothetical protein